MRKTIEQLKAELKAESIHLEEDPTECGDYLAYGDDGRTYRASLCDMGEKLNNIFGNGCGIMYCLRPATVELLGFVKAETKE